MSIELVPYSEFEEPIALAQQLSAAVGSSRALLEQRNIPGPIRRYGQDIETAVENVEKGQAEHLAGELGHFAVVKDGEAVGAASIYPDLRLRKLRLPIPAGIAGSLLSVDFPCANPNIHAWIRDGEEGLGEAYSQLVRLSDTWPGGLAWTVEPGASPDFVHQEIISVRGLTKVATRRFDQGDNQGNPVTIKVHGPIK